MEIEQEMNQEDDDEFTKEKVQQHKLLRQQKRKEMQTGN